MYIKAQNITYFSIDLSYTKVHELINEIAPLVNDLCILS